jgi:hypothetical protein
MPPATANHQNVSIAQLFEWAEKNPNKSKSLAPIGIHDSSELVRKKELSEVKESTLESIGLGDFESNTLSPSGILSVIAWTTDSTYPYLSVRARSAYLRELATRLQQQTEGLAGGTLARRRRKIHDGIGGLANTGSVKPEEHLDLFSGLAIMCGVQLIFVQMSKVEEKERDEEGKEVEDDGEKYIYFSSDPSMWVKEKKTFVVDYYGRWIASPRVEESMKTLVDWVEDLEMYGWIVGWHIDSNMTKDALVKELKEYPTWLAEHSKLKKDVLARRLAKYNTLNTISKIIG